MHPCSQKLTSIFLSRILTNTCNPQSLRRLIHTPPISTAFNGGLDKFAGEEDDGYDDFSEKENKEIESHPAPTPGSKDEYLAAIRQTPPMSAMATFDGGRDINLHDYDYDYDYDYWKDEKMKTNTTTKKKMCTGSKDEYFAVVHRIAHIVQDDPRMEGTLNKLRIAGAAVNSELVFRVLRACQRHGVECLRFFDWAQSYRPSYRPTSIEVEELVKILARTKRHQAMWKTMEKMKYVLDLTVSPQTICFLIEEYGRQGLVDQAVEVFNGAPKIFKIRHSVDVYNSLLFALCESKLFHGAYSLVRRMIRSSVSPSKKTYQILVNAWCSAGKMKEAQNFLDEMSSKGFNPPVRGRDLLIEGLLTAGYLESAKEMVKKMAKNGFVPDIRTFNYLMGEISKHGDLDVCFELYSEACRLGLNPDIDTFKVLITAYSKAGKIDEAFRFFHRSVEDGLKPFPSLYAPILKELCRLGRFDDAVCFFTDMKVKGHPPNRPVYTMMVKMFGRGGRFVEAGNFLIEMAEMGLIPMSKSYDFITDGLKHCGKHDLARRIEQLEITIRGV